MLTIKPIINILAPTILISLSSSLVNADTSVTPMKIYAQAPLHSNTLSTELRSAFAMKEESVELFAAGTIASVWANSDSFNLDYYQNQVITGAQWQLTPKMKAELKYQYNYAGNNGLDSFVHGFHDFFGIGQNGRDEVENDRFNISVPKYGVEINDFEGETLSSALHSYFEYQVFANQYNAISLGASLYFNHVNSGSFKRDSFEQGLQANYSFSYEKHALFSTVGVTFRDNNAADNISYKNSTFAFSAGYGYAITPSHHIVTSYHIYEGSVDDGEDYSEPSNEFVLGYRYLLEKVAFELSVIENAVNMDNSTDIAFTFGVRYVL
ncbi:DUF3187 family protein [Aliivibrio logei]|uniref:DUF3187 family protein n=1 Tax=Aliivibrio logei TaxID=688 RepID=UPI0035C921A6